VHRALIVYVRDRVADRDPDLRKLARYARGFGERAIAFLVDGLGDYPVKR
jgi:hypothetical protein